MATLNSSEIATLYPAAGTVPNLPGRNHMADLKTSRGFINLAANLALTDVIRFCLIPTNAVMDSLVYSCTAITSGAMDVGLHYPSNRSTLGTVLDADFFATAVSVGTAIATSGTDILREATTNTVTKFSQPLWQAAGLSADPGGYFELTGTVTTASSATGQILLIARYGVSGG